MDAERHWPSIVWRDNLPYAAEEPARALTLDEAIDRVMAPALATAPMEKAHAGR